MNRSARGSSLNTLHCSLDLLPAVFRDSFFCFSVPPSPGGSRRRALPFSSGNRRFWAGSGPDPGGNLFLILIFDFASENSAAFDQAHKSRIVSYRVLRAISVCPRALRDHLWAGFQGGSGVETEDWQQMVLIAVGVSSGPFRPGFLFLFLFCCAWVGRITPRFYENDGPNDYFNSKTFWEAPGSPRRPPGGRNRGSFCSFEVEAAQYPG